MTTTDIRQLIFVIGFPRSGTTWFSNLINSHPDTVYRHEVFGRQHASFGNDLFRRLKFDHGLSDSDYATVLRTVLNANLETDRPPFFPKRFRTIRSEFIQQLAWVSARAIPILSPLYAWLYTPRGEEVTLVVKETRSSVDLESIIAGARADKVIVLVRHPYGVIASHLRGIQAGLMGMSSAESRSSWFKYHADASYVRGAAIAEEELLRMSESEFLAVTWRVQNENYLGIHSHHDKSQVIIYDSFLKDRMKNTVQLLRFLELDPDDQIFNFLKRSAESGKRRGILGDASSDYFSVYRAKGARTLWRDVLAAEDLRAIDRRTGELVERLGFGKWMSPEDISVVTPLRTIS